MNYWCAYVISVGLCTSAFGQTTVTYSPSTENIANPERGFYYHHETYSYNYNPLPQTVLQDLLVTDKMSLVMRVFYLQDFVDAPISASYLANMQNDLDVLRNLGIKAIVRFAYTFDLAPDPGPYGDASVARVMEHIAQVGPILSANADVIAFVQAGFIGTWGEWYYTDHFGINPTPSDWTNRRAVIDALLDELPEGTMVQIRTPEYKQIMYGTADPVAENDAFNGSNLSRIGHHNDCFLASPTDWGTYSDTTAEYPYLRAETNYVPMGGETCNVNPPRSECPTAMQEMERFHWSYMNYYYHPDVVDGFEANGCAEEMRKRLGYRFALTDGSFQDIAYSGNTISLELGIANSGFATPYKFRQPKLVLRHTISSAETTFDLTWDVRNWAAGDTTSVTANVFIPDDMPTGDHQMYLWLPDSAATLANNPAYAIAFANTNTWDATTGYNDLLHTVYIQGYWGIADDLLLRSMRISYDPQLNSIQFLEPIATKAEYTITDALGRTLVGGTLTPNMRTLLLPELSTGMYHLTVRSAGNSRLTTKFLVTQDQNSRN